MSEELKSLSKNEKKEHIEFLKIEKLKDREAAKLRKIKTKSKRRGYCILN